MGSQIRHNAVNPTYQYRRFCGGNLGGHLTQDEELLSREIVQPFPWPEMALIRAGEASPPHLARVEIGKGGAVKGGEECSGRGGRRCGLGKDL